MNSLVVASLIASRSAVYSSRSIGTSTFCLAASSILATRISPTNTTIPCMPSLRNFSTSMIQSDLHSTTIALESDVSKDSKPLDNKAQVAAFSARTGILFDTPDILSLVMTHKSAHLESNDRYVYLGSTVLKTFVTEYVLAKYPLMQADIAERVIEAYISTSVVASVGQTLGVHLLMRWKGSTDANSNAVSDGVNTVRASVMHALIGAVYQHKGPHAARTLIHKHFLSRATDVQSIVEAQLKMDKPRKLLAITCKNLKKPKPISRLLGETGRLSSRSVFLVGVYCGIEKIGEGYGSSIKMAEQRACIDALSKHFLTQIKDITLPSDTTTDSEETTTFFEKLPEQ
ncbi:hypothetical protein BATDEDRAFT_37305 [Batrachochytrium dendrobatidis JAM81]|uniref:Large ribosomal subunit protein mL44 n=2 Tax=Batrachochytrium dendrobatidis TaxID=109871 RepID=F4P989_BATDJ|nr:mitochondrial 54S ribosomal protein YmL3 [Batrachochytrium dendrobatidis JAM81]EGF78137.1 hypothetical protein BATDEDRAFT_37305 [Batrachochytrium dendrobatidis JAM81]KAK5667585.1 54S ribosomal protein L3 mitochondrial [Batrachochytrium dendrobatidis]OAJ44391.1 hypothetical protein BDEG_27622 [Batrachochytrium dendrobatidis JEL423]|eukprot:XP_006681180.1 hypothetical protein BATDEDRAFT_37305 [Batrachochytrium dendrobatidis JAM81]